MSSSSHLSIAKARATAANDWTELAVREGDGLEISLLWSKSADRVKVIIFDARHEQEFQLHVASAHALAAFYHPFAYIGSPAEAVLCWHAEQEAA